MKRTTKLRMVGGLVLLFNLWLAGAYNISGVPLVLMTFGVALIFEYGVVRPLSKQPTRGESDEASP